MRAEKISDKIILFLGRNRKRTKTWLAKELNMSRPTLNERLNTNSWTIEDVTKLKTLGIQ